MSRLGQMYIQLSKINFSHFSDMYTGVAGAAAAFIIRATVLLLAAHTVAANLNKQKCSFPAIYNFGDSNSDTGSVSAIYGPIPPPNGVTFFHQPAGRWGDGRLMIDFLAERLGLPYLSGYLDSVGADYRHGANFAMSGSTIELTIIDGRFISAGFNQISFTNQLGQFEQFKNRTTKLYQGKSHTSMKVLPRPQDFSRAIYCIDIGQNDLYFWLTRMGVPQTKAILTELVNNATISITRLYKQGARNYWIHNTGPIGCLPILVSNSTFRGSGDANVDKIGCIKSFNQVARQFNAILREKISSFRHLLSDASFTYVDIYTARYTLTRDAIQLGFTDPFGPCCSNGTCCSNPSQYISWDSIHFTEAANHWVSNRTLNGDFTDPHVPITNTCLKHQ